MRQAAYQLLPEVTRRLADYPWPHDGGKPAFFERWLFHDLMADDATMNDVLDILEERGDIKRGQTFYGLRFFPGYAFGPLAPGQRPAYENPSEREFRLDALKYARKILYHAGMIQFWQEECEGVAADRYQHRESEREIADQQRDIWKIIQASKKKFVTIAALRGQPCLASMAKVIPWFWDDDEYREFVRQNEELDRPKPTKLRGEEKLLDALRQAGSRGCTRYELVRLMGDKGLDAMLERLMTVEKIKRDPHKRSSKAGGRPTQPYLIFDVEPRPEGHRYDDPNGKVDG